MANFGFCTSEASDIFNNDTINTIGDNEIDQVSGNAGTDTCNTDNGPITFDNVFQCELP